MIPFTQKYFISITQPLIKIQVDILIQYKGNTSKYYGISTFENLIEEILQKYQTITDIELSYQNEEGDKIKVSNTHDIYAINDFQQVLIQMNAKVDEEKQKYLENEKEKKKQEMKQKKFIEQQQKKQHAIENEQQTLAKLEQEFTQNLEQKQNELEVQLQEQQSLEQYKTAPLPKFELTLNQASIFDRIKEKVDQLLYIHVNQVLNNKNRIRKGTIQKEIHEIFHQLYEERKNQHSENYKKWNYNNKV